MGEGWGGVRLHTTDVEPPTTTSDTPTTAPFPTDLPPPPWGRAGEGAANRPRGDTTIYTHSERSGVCKPDNRKPKPANHSPAVARISTERLPPPVGREPCGGRSRSRLINQQQRHVHSHPILRRSALPPWGRAGEGAANRPRSDTTIYTHHERSSVCKWIW